MLPQNHRNIVSHSGMGVESIGNLEPSLLTLVQVFTDRAEDKSDN